MLCINQYASFITDLYSWSFNFVFINDAAVSFIPRDLLYVNIPLLNLPREINGCYGNLSLLNLISIAIRDVCFESQCEYLLNNMKIYFHLYVKVFINSLETRYRIPPSGRGVLFLQYHYHADRLLMSKIILLQVGRRDMKGHHDCGY